MTILESDTNSRVIMLSVLVMDGGTERPQNLHTQSTQIVLLTNDNIWKAIICIMFTLNRMYLYVYPTVKKSAMACHKSLIECSPEAERTMLYFLVFHAFRF